MSSTDHVKNFAYDEKTVERPTSRMAAEETITLRERLKAQEKVRELLGKFRWQSDLGKLRS